MQDAQEHWQRLHSQHGLGVHTGTPQAENGPHLALGRVTVGWQALKTLKEQAYRFTTCHGDAVPDASGCGLGKDGRTTEGGKGGRELESPSRRPPYGALRPLSYNVNGGAGVPGAKQKSCERKACVSFENSRGWSKSVRRSAWSCGGRGSLYLFLGVPAFAPKTVANRLAAQEDKPYFWLESTCSANPRLRVELYDWDAVSTHDFLGGVELDVAELVELQRATLGKARANGGTMDQQLLLKTDYPLRSRDNKIGKNGTVGLCIYLDLEQTKRRQRREQAAAARRQQAIELAVAEVDMKNEALERTLMGSEDVDALDMEQMQRRREQDEASSWQFLHLALQTFVSTGPGEDRRQSQPQQQLVVAGGETDEATAWKMFYDDESSDAPVPWWFNSVTGESTWECPTALTTAVSQPGDTGTESESKTGHVGHEVAVVESGVDRGWSQLWSEEYQAYYYVNETTLETSWDAPILAPEIATELGEPAEMTAQGDGQRETAAASASWVGGDGKPVSPEADNPPYPTMSGLKMFECLGDCADFDLVNGCVDRDQADAMRASRQGQGQGQQQQQQPGGTAEDGEYSDGGGSEDGSQRSYSDEEEGSYYSQDEEENEKNLAAGQRTGEYDSNAAYIPPSMTRAPVPVGTPSPGPRGISPSMEKVGAPPPSYDGGIGYAATGNGDLQALRVDAALRAREQRVASASGLGSTSMASVKPGRPTRRSTSVPVDGDEADPADDYSSGGGSGDPASSSAFRSTPGVDEMLAAPTPGRETEGERTWIMARRVASNWQKEEQDKEGSRSSSSAGGMAPEAEQPSPSASRTFVSTRLRHLRLSPDGTTLVVKSDKGGVDHELALDELLEVHETPSEESVTLMGRDIEIRIAFKGQAKALKQFRNMLVPAGSSGTANTTTEGEDGSAATTVTTIKAADPTPAPSSDAQVNRAIAAASEPATTAAAEASNGGGDAETYSNGDGGTGTGNSGGAMAAATGELFDSGSTTSQPPQQQQQQQHGLDGIDEESAYSRDVPPSVGSVMGNMVSNASSGIVSPSSSLSGSGWGSVKGNPAMRGSSTRQMATLSERAAAAQAAALSRSGNSVSGKDRTSSVGGSTFADARERELVIAALQNAEETMDPAEREAKLHLVKYEQAGFVRGYEALCDQQQVRLRKRPEFSDLESVGVEEGLADPSIVLMVLDMARTSVICGTPELVRQLTEQLKACPDVAKIGRMKNGFGSTAVGRGGYRDIKVNLMPARVEHYVEVQVHLREFYELNSRSHEVYEWARGVDLPDGTTPHLLFRNLSPEVQTEMTQLVKDDWMGLRRILPELLQATEQFNEAEPLLRQNVTDAERRWQVAKERFGEGHLHEMSCAQGVAMALNNLALALKGRGDMQGAEPLLRRALAMSVDSQGAEHPEVATRLNSLALLLASDGRVEEAEGLHRQALDIARKVYGAEHADVATYLNNLARVLKAQDKLAEAEPLQRSALAIGERMLGSNHSDVATYYNNLSRLVRAAGKLEEAEPLQRRAVEIGEQVLGPNSPDLATWVNNLGRLLMARKKLAEAEKVQQRAVTIAENVYGPHHAQVARARKNLTKVRWALGKQGRGTR
eukprot:g9894.t1